MTDVAVVIVSYNVRDLLTDCLHSVEQTLAGTGIDYTVVVVDNASGDGSAETVQRDFPVVTLIASPVNVGFAGANNLALRHLGYGGTSADLPRSVLLLNPDTVVLPGAIPALLAVLDHQHGVIVVGPALRDAAGALQASRRCFPTFGTLFWESTVLEQWWPNNPWVRRYRLVDGPDDEPQEVDWLVGAALLVRTAAIQHGGLFDPGYFMYSEELDWQQRLSVVTGGTILYWPAAVVMHYEGKSSEQNLARRQVNFNRSKIRYAQQHFGPARAAALARFLRLQFALQLVIEGAKWLLHHKRTLRAERIQQYRIVLRELAEAPTRS